jgi:uncharacterized membrane protein (UPF0127 family)
VPSIVALAAALVASCAATPADYPPSFALLEQTEVRAETASGTHRFKVWIAADDESRERGLMHVRRLPSDRGMLFVFDEPRSVAFWMKDTYVSLDLVFIGPDGGVVNIAPHAQPLSLDPIFSAAPVSFVLELAAGTAAGIRLTTGDRIVLTKAPVPGA